MIAQPTQSSGSPALDGCIARAEHRRGKLERLSDIGMELAEEIRDRNVKAEYHPEPRHDPSRAFASVSRAVRLTVMLEGRIDIDILAMCRGEAPLDPRGRAAAGGAGGPSRRAVSEAGDPDEPRSRERTWECLTEREDEEEFLEQPFDVCLATISADLGLSAASSREAGEPRQREEAILEQVDGGAAASGPVDDRPCAPTFPSRPAWPITGPPRT